MCVSRGRSSCGTCPQSSSTCWAPGTASLTWRAKAIGTSWSWRPHTNSASGSQRAQARPEPVVALGLLEVDLARRRRRRRRGRAGSGTRAGTRPRRRPPSRRPRRGSGGARSPRPPRRGASCSSPSSGRTRRSSRRPAAARAARPATAPAAPRRSTRSGCAQADLERDAPAEAVADQVRRGRSPARRAADQRRGEEARRRRARRSACRSRRSQAGRPRWRGTGGASAATVGSNETLVRAEAVDQEHRIARPGLQVGERPSACSNVAKRSARRRPGRWWRPGSRRRRAGCGARSGACAGTRPSRRARPRRSGAHVAASAVSTASGSTVGALEARHAADDHRIRGAVAGRGETHPGFFPGRVEHLGVVAADELLQRFGGHPGPLTRSAPSGDDLAPSSCRTPRRRSRPSPSGR